MTRIKLQYVHEYEDRTGVVRRYFRKRGQPKIPLPGIVGSEAFMQAYQQALHGTASRPSRYASNTIGRQQSDRRLADVIQERWQLSHRADKRALPLADRHYNRQKVGSPQYVPPGRCLCLISEGERALWVTSWPFAQYVKHAWAGAWVNSLFRKECPGKASDMIRAAVAATRMFWEAPERGIVTFVDPDEVPGVVVRGERLYGYGYLKAGWKHVGFTKAGLWAWQQLPADMPPAAPPIGMQSMLFNASA